MRAPTACAYLAFMTCDICVNPWHVRSMLSFSFAIDSSSDPPSEIEHGKFFGKALFECTGCLLHRLPFHRLPIHRLPVHRLPVAPFACCSSCLFTSCLFTGCLSSDIGFIKTECEEDACPEQPEHAISMSSTLHVSKRSLRNPQGFSH